MKMSRRAKRMERHHRRNKGPTTINIIPMIDLLTVLVFFLLVSASDVQNIPNTKSLKLPESTAEQKPKDTIVLMVNNQDIIVQGHRVASATEALSEKSGIIPALEEELAYQARRTRASRPADKAATGDITIMGDRQIPYLLLKKIMVTCTRSGYNNISLAVSSKSARG